MDSAGLLSALCAEREQPEYDYGTWLLVENARTSFATSKHGWHPWVLVQPTAPTRVFSIAIPRSRSSDEGIRHDPHPHPPHICQLEEEGRLVVLRKAKLHRATVFQSRYSCIEPDPTALQALLRNGR